MAKKLAQEEPEFMVVAPPVSASFLSSLFSGITTQKDLLKKEEAASF